MLGFVFTLQEIEEKYEAAHEERKRLERSLHKKEAEMEQRLRVSVYHLIPH